MKADVPRQPKVFKGIAQRVRQIPRRRALILLVAWLISMWVGYQLYQGFTGPTMAPIQGTVALVTRGAISATVSAPGSVIANREANLTFGVSGRISEVLTSVGSAVKAGDPLAKLETAPLDIKLAQAQSALRVAEINLQQLQEGGMAEDVASAQAAYDSAVANYNEISKGATEAELKNTEQTLAAAQASLQKAEADLATLKAGPDPDQVRAAELELERAKNSLWATQIDRDGLKGNPMTPDYQKAAADARVAAAETAVTQAQVNLDAVKAGPKAEEVSVAEKNAASAQAAVAAAQAALDALKARPTESELLAAQNNVATAKAQLARTQGGSPEEIALAEEQVKQARATVQQVELDINNSTIVAPFDGLVASVGGSVGEQASAATAMFLLIDPQTVRLEASVAEIDFGRLAVGQKVEAGFDALPNQLFEGQVASISPKATIQQGVANYLVYIDIQTGETVIPPGMSASVTIVVNEKEDVLLAPNRAIRLDGRNRVVDVVVGDQLETRTVQIGLSNDQFTEVLDGLKEGEQLLIATTPDVGSRMMGAQMRVAH